MREVEVRRWTRDEYERMGETGIIGPEERVELVDGEIVRMTPQGGRHARAIQAAGEALRKVLRGAFDIRVQLPLALDPCSEPEPDISVVRGNWRDYTSHPESAVLVVEVADTTLGYDRRVKASLYARAGVPEYWIVNLSDNRIEVFCDPAPSETARHGWSYRTERRFGSGQHLSPAMFPAAAIAVDDLLG
jgi:Uma2 family endonuclease